MRKKAFRVLYFCTFLFLFLSFVFPAMAAGDQVKKAAKEKKLDINQAAPAEIVPVIWTIFKEKIEKKKEKISEMKAEMEKMKKDEKTDPVVLKKLGKKIKNAEKRLPKDREKYKKEVKKLAGLIVFWRSKNGAFDSAKELKKVPGLSKKKVDLFENKIIYGEKVKKMDEKSLTNYVQKRECDINAWTMKDLEDKKLKKKIFSSFREIGVSKNKLITIIEKRPAKGYKNIEELKKIEELKWADSKRGKEKSAWTKVKYFLKAGPLKNKKK